MRTREVVTCFLEHQGKLLVLRRSQTVRTHRGKWAGVSGSVEGATPPEQALKEIAEETGLDTGEVRLVRTGEALEVADRIEVVTWLVHPFLFRVTDPAKIRLDWEHSDHRWVHPDELSRLDTVPRLKETWERLV